MSIQKKIFKKGFTLVELIIVIAIIAILAVTAFLLLTKWLSKARDSSRASNLANIENSLQISITDKSSLPKPDSYTLIYASGTANVVGYQGYFGEGVKDAVGNINSAPKDGDDYFTYYLNADLNKYQLASFMENEIAYNPNVVSAVDYSSRYVNVKGDKLGLLTDSNKSPLQSLGLTGLDLLTGTVSYISYLDNSTNIAGTGKQLFTYYYNQTTSLLKNKDLAKGDSSLVGYWDMETLTGTLLADLSQYGNNGACYDSGTLVTCGNAGGPQFVQGKVGKAMQFDGMSGNIIYTGTTNSSKLSIGTGNFTISVNIKIPNYLPDDYRDNILGNIFDSVYPSNGFVLAVRGKLDIVNNQKKLYFAINGAFDGVDWLNISSIYSDSSIADDKWHNVIIVFDRTSRLKMYIDGILQKSSGNLNNTVDKDISSANSSFKVGTAGDSPYYSKLRRISGIIDEVRIYNRALSDDEVKALYNAN